MYFPNPAFQGHQQYGPSPYGYGFGYGPPPFQGPPGFHSRPPRGFRGRPFPRPPRGQYVPKRGGPHKRYRDSSEIQRHDVPGAKHRSVGYDNWDSDPYYDKSMFEDPWKALLPSRAEAGGKGTPPATLPPQSEVGSEEKETSVLHVTAQARVESEVGSPTVLPTRGGEANSSTVLGKAETICKDDSSTVEVEQPLKDDSERAETAEMEGEHTVVQGSQSSKHEEKEPGSFALGTEPHIPQETQSEAASASNVDMDQSPESEDPVKEVVVTESSGMPHDTAGSEGCIAATDESSVTCTDPDKEHSSAT